MHRFPFLENGVVKVRLYIAGIVGIMQIMVPHATFNHAVPHAC